MSLSFRWWRSFHSLQSLQLLLFVVRYQFEFLVHGLSSRSLSFRWWRSFHSLHPHQLLHILIRFQLEFLVHGLSSRSLCCKWWRSRSHHMHFNHYFLFYVSSSYILFTDWALCHILLDGCTMSHPFRLCPLSIFYKHFNYYIVLCFQFELSILYNHFNLYFSLHVSSSTCFFMN